MMPSHEGFGEGPEAGLDMKKNVVAALKPLDEADDATRTEVGDKMKTLTGIDA